MWFKQGQIEVECGIGCDCGNVECGDKPRDGHAKRTFPSPHPIPNQSKPIVPTPSYSFS